jgi:hypothetical protein
VDAPGTTTTHPATSRTPRSPRWDLLHRYTVDVDGKLHLDRLRLVQTPLFAVLLTRILEPDPGRDPHNHSRRIVWTFILRGGYTETVWPMPDLIGRDPCGALARICHEREHGRWSAMKLPQHWAHRITDVRPGTLTLVLAGRHRRAWSFWTAHGPVDWRDYG